MISLFFRRVEKSHSLIGFPTCTSTIQRNHSPTEYDSMDLEMLREVVPMLRQQLEKSMLDRNYVQLERVSNDIDFIHLFLMVKLLSVNFLITYLHTHFSPTGFNPGVL